MSKNPLSRLLDIIPPLTAAARDERRKQKEFDEVAAQIHIYVDQYNGARDKLKLLVGGAEKYPIEEVKAKMQQMIDASENLKRLSIPNGYADEAEKHHFNQAEKYTMFLDYKAVKLITNQERRFTSSKPEDIEDYDPLFRQVREIFPSLETPNPQVSTNETKPANVISQPANAAPENKKTGFFSKLKGYAAYFKSYLKEHPIRGGIIIGVGILGLAAIITASVFTGGAAGVAAVGGFAALFAVSPAVAGISVGAVALVGSAVALGNDISKHVVMKKSYARLHPEKKSEAAATATANKNAAPTINTEEKSSTVTATQSATSPVDEKAESWIRERRPGERHTEALNVNSAQGESAAIKTSQNARKDLREPSEEKLGTVQDGPR